MASRCLNFSSKSVWCCWDYSYLSKSSSYSLFMLLWEISNCSISSILASAYYLWFYNCSICCFKLLFSACRCLFSFFIPSAAFSLNFALSAVLSLSVLRWWRLSLRVSISFCSLMRSYFYLLKSVLYLLRISYNSSSCMLFSKAVIFLLLERLSVSVYFYCLIVSKMWESLL
jgi:hypothetical protein